MASRRDPSKPYPHDYLFKYTFDLVIPDIVSPNAITILRFILTPFVIWLLAVENFDIGIPLFLFAAFTDALDGSIARLRDEVTDWGTFYDPVADKLLISTTVLLIVIKYINLWLALIIVGIELMIIYGGYKNRQENEKPIAANFYGKVKMMLQVLGVTFLLGAVWFGVDLFIPMSVGTFAVAIVFAIISLYTYSL
jgi:CDP-diacylglycerol--glycerol-3-phosphate 3-phosphatidyltransferase